MPSLGLATFGHTVLVVLWLRGYFLIVKSLTCEKSFELLFSFLGACNCKDLEALSGKSSQHFQIWGISSYLSPIYEIPGVPCLNRWLVRNGMELWPCQKTNHASWYQIAKEILFILFLVSRIIIIVVNMFLKLRSADWTQQT